MLKRILIISVALLSGHSVVHAQSMPNFLHTDFNSYKNGTDPLAMQMKAFEQNLIQGNMQNPQVQAMYRQYRAQGGTMSLQQFALQYAETGGFTPQGKQTLYNNNVANAARVKQSWQGLQGAQQQSSASVAQMQQHFHKNQAEAGNQLLGNSTYIQPQTGASYVLPHNVPANTVTYHPGSGQYFRIDNFGQYSVYKNGYWQPMVR